MKDLVRDTVWFKTPTGGEIKLTLPGYEPEEVENMVTKLTEQGYVVVSHETEYRSGRPFPPAWFLPFMLGVSAHIVAVMLLEWIRVLVQ